MLLAPALGPKIITMIVVACGLSACGLIDGASEPIESATATEELRPRSSAQVVDPESSNDGRPSDHRLEWVDCEGPRWCGWLDVPLDYGDPDGEMVRLRFDVQLAGSGDLGAPYLFFNPGGPGRSVVDFLLERRSAVASDAVRHRFHLVGLDPRGVGMSGPEFSCGAPGEQDELLDGLSEPGDAVGVTEQLEAAAELCSTSMGSHAGAFHTGLAAHDHEQLRQALGAPSFNYVGYSYGTFLGLLYATYFPENVRAMVLDAAYPPGNADGRQSEAEVRFPRAVESAIGDLLAACDQDCAIYNDGDPEAYFLLATEKADLLGPTSGADSGRFGSAVLANLYDRVSWPRLWTGLAALVEHDDPSMLIEDAEALRSNGDSGPLRRHVNCLDSWLVDGPSVGDSVARDSASTGAANRADDATPTQTSFEERFPLYAAIDFGTTYDPCRHYDFAPEPLAGPLDGGGAPVLVIGNSADAITPLSSSAIVAREMLLNGYLVEVEHPAHTVYPFNPCVISAVDEVLIDAVYPTARTQTCDTG